MTSTDVLAGPINTTAVSNSSNQAVVTLLSSESVVAGVPVISPTDSRAITLLAKKITARECILFLGAGVHYHPPSGSPFVYPESERPPLGRELCKQLAQECDFAQTINLEECGNLLRVSQHYEAVHGRFTLIDRVTSAVSDNTKPSKMLRALAEMDFPLVVTTNYDQLFETALSDANKKIVPSIYDSSGAQDTTDLPNIPPRGETFVRPHRRM